MKSRITGAIVVASLAVGAPSAEPRPGQSLPPRDVSDYRAEVQRYCVTCHSDRLRTGGLSLELADVNAPQAEPDVWERAVKKIRVGMMPPQGSPQPSAETREGLVRFLTLNLDRAAASYPAPGRKLIHRLNRAEYANAVRDLLSIEVDASAFLPPDDSAYGFDNIADVLGSSPLLIEQYLSAAGRISAMAVGDLHVGTGSETYRVRQDASQHRHIEGLSLGTVGGMLVKTTLPLDADYEIQPRLFRTNLGAVRGLETANELEITVDGARVHLVGFGGDEDFKASLRNPTSAGDMIDARLRARVQLPAGPHAVGVAFVERAPAQGSLRLQQFLRSSHDTFDIIGYPHLEQFVIERAVRPERSR